MLLHRLYGGRQVIGLDLSHGMVQLAQGLIHDYLVGGSSAGGGSSSDGGVGSPATAPAGVAPACGKAGTTTGMSSHRDPACAGSSASAAAAAAAAAAPAAAVVAAASAPVAFVADACDLGPYAPAAAVFSIFGLQQMGPVAPQVGQGTCAGAGLNGFKGQGLYTACLWG